MKELLPSIFGLIGSVIVAFISYMGIKATNKQANDSMQNELKTQQALYSQKLDILTEEVRSHNNFARRLPVVEQQISDINRRFDDVDKRIDKVETTVSQILKDWFI